MKNGIKVIAILITALFLLSGIPTVTVHGNGDDQEEVSCGKRILLYSTEAVANRPSGSYLGTFQDLPAQMATYGYNVTVVERYYIPLITSTLLSNYSQLWLMGTNRDLNTPITPAEVIAIQNFVADGGGLVIAGEHRVGWDYSDDVIPIASVYGVTFAGSYTFGNLPINPTFDPTSPLFNGVTTLVGHSSEPRIVVIDPVVKVVATYSGNNLIAVRDDGIKVVFDRSWIAFGNIGPGNSLSEDHPQYLRNLADYLEPDSEDATVDIDPDTVNLKSRGKWITAYIELPNCNDEAEIDLFTVLLEDSIPAITDPKYGFVKSEDSYIMDHDGDGILERMVKFDRSDVEDMLVPGTYNLKVTMQMNDGLYFEGYSDTITVIDPP
jgi:hypothetical protein